MLANTDHKGINVFQVLTEYGEKFLDIGALVMEMLATAKGNVGKVIQVTGDRDRRRGNYKDHHGQA